MDHRPFEGWLLDSESLNAEEKRQLDAHLQMCPSCTALAEVNLALKMVKMAAPAEGFADRFQVRLGARKKEMRRRHLWGFLFLGLIVLSVLTLISWPVLIVLIHSPVDLLASWLGGLFSIWSAVTTMAHAGLDFFRVVPGFIPAYVWAVIVFAACSCTLLCVFSFVKFTRFMQGV